MFDVKNGAMTVFNEQINIGMKESELVDKVKDYIMVKENYIDSRKAIFLKECEILGFRCYVDIAIYRKKVRVISFSVRNKKDNGQETDLKDVSESFNNEIQKLLPDIKFDQNGTFDYQEGEYKLSSSFNKDNSEYIVFLNKQ